MTWLAGLSLRIKLWGVIALGVLTTIGYLWLRWRIAASRAASATAKAERLEATHRLETDIAIRREKLADRQRKLREQIAGSEAKDFFNGGWGP